jgi:gliding motility-associated lipoprotein GldH
MRRRSFCSQAAFAALWLVGLLTSLLCLPGCGQDNQFRRYEEIPNFVWRHSDSIRFEVAIGDTQTRNNLFLSVRHTPQFRYRNLWVDLVQIAPDGDTTTERHQLLLARPNGQWLGSGLGDLIDREQLVRRNFRFPHTGRYVFIVRHAMRPDEVRFLMDIGLLIVETER